MVGSDRLRLGLMHGLDDGTARGKILQRRHARLGFGVPSTVVRLGRYNCTHARWWTHAVGSESLPSAGVEVQLLAGACGFSQMSGNDIHHLWTMHTSFGTSQTSVECTVDTKPWLAGSA